MYNSRLKFLIIIFIIALAVVLARLFDLQILSRGEALKQIENIGVRKSEILPTVRGSITDRNGRVLAVDVPEFYIAIQYELARLRDDRFWESNALIRADSKDVSVDEGRRYWEQRFSEEIELLDEIVSKAYSFSSAKPGSIEKDIDQINDRMWRMRSYFAWKRNFPNSESKKPFNALEDNEQLKLEGYINDLAEMKTNWYLLSKINDEMLHKAQDFFEEIDQVRIIPRAKRQYPYNDCASQTIGWVTPQKRDNEIFASDELTEYKEEELAGYKAVEYVCEPLLRGKRGKITYNADGSPSINQQAREFGRNIRLTIDIELQKELEGILSVPSDNSKGLRKTAAVIIDVQSADIIAMASLPKFNLNTARTKFGELINDPNKPMVNRAIQKIYPPGSTIKPTILAAGLQEGEVTPQTTISCPLPAEQGWPRCWIQREYSCHDDQFAGEGGNNGVNAIRGSCNIYFTKLAHRLDSRKLQKWLYKFGYGRKILQEPDFTLADKDLDLEKLEDRNIRQQRGFISDKLTREDVKGFEEIPKLSPSEKRWFGMGQGNLRVTVLQVANSFASIARDGIFMNPRLYLNCGEQIVKKEIGTNPQTIETIKEGLWSVINTRHGTAHRVFQNSELLDTDLKLFGKTGSTERPDNAWFAGFAIDKKGNSVAFALIVEGGQSGARDGAPLGKEIFNLCIRAGYLQTDSD